MQTIMLRLPPLIEGHQVPWRQPEGETAESGDYTVLARIAEGLRLLGLVERQHELVSIPDVWAQVEVFRSALFERHHPLHRRAVGEWRGLLAIFALSAYRDGIISAQRIVLDEAVVSGPDRRLINMLNRIKPVKTLTPRHNWHEIGLIRVGDAVAGMLVPTTLVCPARRPPPMLVDRLPWALPDRLIDPLLIREITAGERDDLSIDEIAVLAQFCRDAIALLDGDPASRAELAKQDSGLVGCLREAFVAFAADADKAGAQTVTGRFESRQLNLAMPPQPLYPLLAGAKFLIRPRQLDTMIRVRPELENAGLKGILLIDRDLPQALGKKASEITVWGNTSLQRVLDEFAVRDTVKREAGAEGYLCLGPEDLFTKQFYRTNGSQVASHPTRLQDALLPVSPAVTMLLPPADLRSAIDVDPGWRETSVTLRLRLADDTVGPLYYTMRRTYAESEIISRDNPPTTLAFWPDFELADWHWHFAYYGGNLQQHFTPRTFVAMRSMAAFIERGTTPTERVALARQLVEDPPFLAKELALQQTNSTVELYVSDATPEALYCDCVTDPQATGFVERRLRKPVGMLLLSDHDRPIPSAQRCQIGIDFGTVNTSVYRRLQNAREPERVVFRSRLILPFAPTGDAQRQAYQEFLPLVDAQIPFMTVLRNRQVAAGGAVELPLWGSHIYYMTETERALREVNGNRLRFDLKWATEREERRPILTFLSQVALQSLAETAAEGISPANVSWRFSYPEAYSLSQLHDFWNTATRAVRIAVDPRLDTAEAFDNGRDPGPIPTTDSESLSTALYFITERNEEASPAGDLVTVDMGGLTSDVSIWHAGSLIWRNSLKLAGRDIVIRYLERNFELVRSIGESNDRIAALVRQVETLPDAKRSNGIEMLMNSSDFSAAFVKNFAQVGAEPAGRGLRVVAELALLGMLYYVGKTMMYCLRQSPAYQGISSAHVAVCLGGRTSLLYGALFDSGGRQSRLAPGMGVFKDAAPGLIASTREVYSRRPKHEVAYGLLVPQTGARDFQVDDRSRVIQVILGEAIQADGRLFPPDTATIDVPRNGRWTAGELTELKAFLSGIEQHAQIGVTLDAEQELRIRHKIEEQLADDRDEFERSSGDAQMNDARLRRELRLVEPPFIVGLRELIAIIIEDGSVARAPD